MFRNVFLSDAVNEVSLADSPEKAKPDNVNDINDTNATSSMKPEVVNSNIATPVTKPQTLSLSSDAEHGSLSVDYMSLSVSGLSCYASCCYTSMNI